MWGLGFRIWVWDFGFEFGVRVQGLGLSYLIVHGT